MVAERIGDPLAAALAYTPGVLDTQRVFPASSHQADHGPANVSFVPYLTTSSCGYRVARSSAVPRSASVDQLYEVSSTLLRVVVSYFTEQGL